MAALTPIPRGEQVSTADQRVVLHRVPWAHYEVQLALKGESSVPRITYLDGAMELMSPSKDHERIKSYIGILVEAYALERGIDLSPYGGWTLREAPREVGVEPDECYLMGPDQGRDRPDLVIEVAWTHGGLDKLEVYRRLEIPEVWLWKDGALQAYRLGRQGYSPTAGSACLPGLCPGALTAYFEQPTATQAVRALRADLARETGA
ncbi:MAG: Uma2 family endonuclease [Planctomycetes bacterium]|nr:Uma2 family endonuclease [Planctomycetota bacterium]